MVQEKTTRRDGAQTTALVVEGLVLVAAPAALGLVLPDYLVWRISSGLYILVALTLIVVHALMFRKRTWTILLLAVYIVAFFTGGYLSVATSIRDGVWVWRARSCLWNVQLSVERYALDHDGHYPEFLIGGEYTEGEASPDPLFRGYLEGYPRNEAARRSLQEPDSEYMRDYIKLRSKYPWLIGAHYYWSDPDDIAELQRRYGDYYDGAEAPSRFGEHYTLMGNIAADHRFPDAQWGYPYWERRTGSRDLLTVDLQGQFYYKVLYRPGSDQPDGYILMVFGSYADDGMDAFTTVSGGHELDGRLPDGSGVGMGVPVIPQPGLESDGKPDGVLLVLFGGWPWEERPISEGEQ